MSLEQQRVLLNSHELDQDRGCGGKHIQSFGLFFLAAVRVYQMRCKELLGHEVCRGCRWCNCLTVCGGCVIYRALPAGGGGRE